MADVSGKEPVKMTATEDDRPVQDLATHGAHPALGEAFAVGARMGVRITRTPSDPKMASKERVNLASRSRMRSPTLGSHSAI